MTGTWPGLTKPAERLAGKRLRMVGIDMQVKPIVALLRPQQWIKNTFVFAGLLFSHSWGNLSLLLDALLVFLAFCMISSATYAFNDVRDAEHDRLHPSKRLRPIAAGALRPRPALMLAAVLGLAGTGIAGGVGVHALIILCTYLAVQVAYSLHLKHVVVLDAFCISAGFMCRLLAGTVGLGIPPSPWFLFCGAMLTLFLAFAKRRSEVRGRRRSDDGAGNAARTTRPVLDEYTIRLLDMFLAISATGCVLGYGLYTMSPETARVHGTHYLIVTLPFVLYGLFRYLYLLEQRTFGEDTSREFFADRHLMATFALWLLLTLWLIH